MTEVVSVMDEQIMSLDSNQVDLLITTVPLAQVNVPFVQINPILKDEDIRKINDLLSNLIPTSTLLNMRSAGKLKDRLISLNEYSKIIIKLIDNYQYMEGMRFTDMKEVISYVSRNLSDSEEEERILNEAFVKREEKGSTILGRKGMLLLHCRGDISKEVSIQVLQMDNPVFIPREGEKIPVDTIVIMVAPVVINQKILELLSEISRNIITEGFDEVLKTKNELLIENELHQILEKFYQRQVFNFE